MLRTVRLLFLYSILLAGPALAGLTACNSEFDKHYDLAKQYRDEERFEDAIREFELAAQADPTSGKPYYRIAKILKTQNRNQEAAAYLEKAVKLEPDSAEFYPEYIKALRRSGQLDKAQEVAAQALQLKAVKRDSEAVKDIESELAEIEIARKAPPSPAPGVTTGPVETAPTTAPAEGQPTTGTADSTPRGGAGRMIPPTLPTQAAATAVEDLPKETADTK